MINYFACRPIIQLLVLITFLLNFLGCNSSPEQKAGADSRYIRKEAANTGVIVFVHGVSGNSAETWANTATGTYWPDMLTKDSTFKGFNVYVYDYNTPLLEKSYSIDELAENMRLVFDDDGVFDHSNVVFVAHSMGGLVTRDFLLKYRKAAEKVKLINFYGTPTTGSEVARLAKFVSDNPQFGKMMSMKSEDYLADQQRAWLAAGFDIPSYCAYELKETFGQKIVEQQSATNLCNRRLDPINANHIDIVKPGNTKDVSYLTFKNAFREVFPDTQKELTDWNKYLKVNAGSANCPMFSIPPASIQLAEGSAEAYRQIFDTDYSLWPEIADIYQPYFLMLHIESIIDSNKWIKIEPKVKVTIERDEAGLPETTNVVLVGECGGTGEPRWADRVVLLAAGNQKKEQVIAFKKAPYYTLQPGEFEEFEIKCLCGSPGAYTITYELPFSISGQSGTMVFKDTKRIICPDAYNLWSTRTLDDDQEAEVGGLHLIDAYRWDGTNYLGKKRNIMQEHSP